MEIIITTKNVYGNTLIYPVCAKAQTFATLINKKTFSKDDLALIELLGFKIKTQ